MISILMGEQNICRNCADDIGVCVCMYIYIYMCVCVCVRVCVFVGVVRGFVEDGRKNCIRYDKTGRL